jgi:hypothetical protein
MQELLAPTTALQDRRRSRFDQDDCDLYGNSFEALARADFWSFRKLIRPNMLDSWWQKDLALRLNKFWRDSPRTRSEIWLASPPLPRR